MKYVKKMILAVLLCFLCCSCANKKEEETIGIVNYPTKHETEFGGVYIEITIDDFNALGFTYGDSVDIEFSNGFVLEDIPYYNGYYCDPGETFLVGYPGYEYIKAAVNYGDDLWETGGLYMGLGFNPDLWLRAELDEHCTATIRLREKAKYLAIQGARDIQYYDEREKYESDVIFANFREISCGNIKEGILYRSASPCDNQHQRAPYVDELIKKHGVNCILNLADDEEKIQRYIDSDGFASTYFLSLYETDRVIPLALSMNYLSDVFAAKIADGFLRMTEMDGPYLIHCTEGKDRTGFVCMLVEALCNASYQEIADDYMLTYANYYDITKEKEADKYQVILEKNLDAMLRTVVGDERIDFKTEDLSVYARNYLLNAGMDEQQIEALIRKLCE